MAMEQTDFILELANSGDREELRRFWSETFQDGEDFSGWFFEHRFLPSYCAVARKDGRIQSCVHALPAFVRVRDTVLPCAIVGGVSTRPEARGHGLMHRVMKLLLNQLRDYGTVAVVHRPAHLTTFYSLGHFPVSDMRYLNLSAHTPRPFQDCCEELQNPSPLPGLFRCYEAYARRYSGIIARSYGDFVLKFSEYQSTNAKTLFISDENGIAGYCVYFEEPEQVYGDEFVALSEDAAKALYEGLALRAQGKAVSVRMARDLNFLPQGAEAIIEPKNVMGAVHIPALLKAVGLSGGAIRVTDPVIPANNGIFSLDGAPVFGLPKLEITAGRLTQWAVGYRTVADIVEKGEAVLLDPAIQKEMDAAGLCPCSIIDEY